MKKEKVQIFYNTIADKYAEKLFNELDGKSLDRILLTRFADNHKDKGLVLDLGCGPGQTTKFLYDVGLKNILGIDLSEQMIKKAQELNPNINFRVGDMLQLDFEDQSIDSAIAFYAIVHFQMQHLEIAFSEIYRVLKSKSDFLFSFHIGSKVNEVDNFYGQPASATFYFFEVEDILNLLKKVGFSIKETVIRYPYADVEYPSQRAYITAWKS